MATAVEALTNPERIWSRAEVLGRPSPVPDRPGLYGWFFREIPGPMDTSGCVKYKNLTLLYAGISPKKPPAIGKPSEQNLRKRIRYHYRGNAYGSTLRLTVGSLLADKLGIQLRRVGSGHRLTFAAGEDDLSAWMARNAFVCWCETAEPWLAEEEMIAAVDLPLNLDQNSHHAFHAFLSGARARQRDVARTLPIV